MRTKRNDIDQDLPFEITNTHAGDPETSHLAAVSVREQAEGQAERVFDYLARWHPKAFASHELSKLLGDLAPTQVSRRLSDLKRAGRIVVDGERYRNPSGSMADRYRSRRVVEARPAKMTPREKLESQVEALEARVADLERKLRTANEWNRELRAERDRSSRNAG